MSDLKWIRADEHMNHIKEGETCLWYLWSPSVTMRDGSYMLHTMTYRQGCHSIPAFGTHFARLTPPPALED